MKQLEFTSIYVIESLRDDDSPTGTKLFYDIIPDYAIETGKSSENE